MPEAESPHPGAIEWQEAAGYEALFIRRKLTRFASAGGINPPIWRRL